MENFEIESRSAAERELYLPLINTDEQRFIEDTGGEYAGYIRSEDGHKRYEQFRVDRRARYNEERREVVETYIATEIIDREGEKDLRSPSDAAGFSILVSELSRVGAELGKPEIIMVRSVDFKHRRVSTAELLELARQAHAFASEQAHTLDCEALGAALKDYLRSAGWDR